MADGLESDWLNLAVALGIGLLLGAERERRKGEGPRRSAAGIRTFALVSLLGGLAMALGGGAALAVAGGFVAAAALASYLTGDRSDPGLTTEVAIVVAFLLGALAWREPAIASGVAVAVTILLAARSQIHRFVRTTLTEDELHDALLFAAAALVILPVVPNETVGPYDVLNPFRVWLLVVLVMAVGGLGYVAVRVAGPRFGLSVAGFAGGFISSSATIGSMGGRARAQPALRRAAVSGAVLSTVATVVMMVAVVGTTSEPALRELAPAMGAAGLAAVAYGSIFAIRAATEPIADGGHPGRAFDMKVALGFAATVTVVLFASAVLSDRFGRGGLTLATAAAGFADTHSAAISVASLVAAGRLDAADAVLPILAGFTTNTITKVVLSLVSGPRPYFRDVSLGVALVAAAAWVAFAVQTASRGAS